MNKSKLVILFFLCILFSCKDKDPCDKLVEGVYIFPELPENHNMTSEEIDEYFDLPEDICNCISTEGLVETCFNYPYLSLIMAGSSMQSGYDLLYRERFRGIRELETRPERGTLLIERLLAFDPLGYNPDWELLEIGRYTFNFSYTAVILGQYVNIEVLTLNEKITLLEKSIDTYEKMLNDPDIYGNFSLECASALMGRLMYFDNYDPLIDLYNSNEKVMELIYFFAPPVGYETVDLVYNLSKNYLELLKS